MSTSTTNSDSATIASGNRSSRSPWLWWGVVAGVAGLGGNFVSTHDSLTDAGPDTALASVGRGAYHVGTALGLISFVALLLLAAGWARWSGTQRGIAGPAVATGLATTAALVLFATGLRGGLAEYAEGGINEDNFPAEGLYVLFMLHDTAPWFAWWGVLVAAGVSAYLAFRTTILPTWLGIVCVLALLPPLGVLAGSGAVAGAGLTGPLWLVISSATLALRGLPRS